MPTYDYRCNTCDEVFEIFQSFSEDALTECPTGGCTGSVKKIFSAPGISFKGSGFYKNDSRSSASSSTKKTSAEATKTDASETKTTTPPKDGKDSSSSSTSSDT